jgi:2-polyprenyl-3-methyl-5-hydroxy-6-metoxy-1,4-benzoquinol methylase
MTNNELSIINSYSWYQTVDFNDGVKSKGIAYCGDPAWGNIKTFLPDNLNNKRVLDLGCNAGVFCIRSILMGASECIGIDSNDWKKDDYLGQAKFVKEYFEKKHNKIFNINYIKGRMEDVLKQDLGKFDYCYAIASLYYSSEPEFVVKRLSEICSNAIVRLRDADRIERFTSLFVKYGFVLRSSVQEKWYEKLNTKTDDFYMYHYVNEKLIF